jgi:excisionase family DNA binding protein
MFSVEPMIAVENLDKVKLLRAAEVAILTGFSRAKVYLMIESGELPSIRAGRSVRIPRVALERWVEENTTGGKAR